jgi:hypothetical protein
MIFSGEALKKLDVSEEKSTLYDVQNDDGRTTY